MQACHAPQPPAQAGGGGMPTRWLASTPLLQRDHPRLRLQALKLTQLRPSDRDKALACFDFVRRLPLHIDADAACTTAVEVLARGCGDARTKSTLFIALLRSIGIAARVRLVRLPPDCLHGLMRPGGLALDHAFTEVWLQGRWLGLDTYVPDPRLALAARARLLREQRVAGWGLHLRGHVGWSGESHALGTFHWDDPVGHPQQDWGVYDDVSQFRPPPGGLEGGWTGQLRWALHAAAVNRRLRALRDGTV